MLIATLLILISYRETSSRDFFLTKMWPKSIRICLRLNEKTAAKIKTGVSWAWKLSEQKNKRGKKGVRVQSRGWVWREDRGGFTVSNRSHGGSHWLCWFLAATVVESEEDCVGSNRSARRTTAVWFALFRLDLLISKLLDQHLHASETFKSTHLLFLNKCLHLHHLFFVLWSNWRPKLNV